MVFHEKIAKEIASHLLQINAIKLNVQNPFVWASGWRSPIYCDNRLSLSFPSIRTEIRRHLAMVVRDHFPAADGVVGVATAGIAHGTLVADELDLPFAYVRSKSKGHGLQNKIEGEISEGKEWVVIEDLISTGKSSLAAVEALRLENVQVAGLAAIFTYDFPVARERFLNADCKYVTLSDYNYLLEVALEKDHINTEDLKLLKNWRQKPESWGV